VRRCVCVGIFRVCIQPQNEVDIENGKAERLVYAGILADDILEDDGASICAKEGVDKNW